MYEKAELANYYINIQFSIFNIQFSTIIIFYN